MCSHQQGVLHVQNWVIVPVTKRLRVFLDFWWMLPKLLWPWETGQLKRSQNWDYLQQIPVNYSCWWLISAVCGQNACCVFRQITMWTEKKHTKMFLSYLPQNPVDSDKIEYALSWINLRCSSLNVFQLTWIMPLHYLVKLSVRVL